MLDHEKLDVYQCSISFLSVSIPVLKPITLDELEAMARCARLSSRGLVSLVAIC